MVGGEEQVPGVRSCGIPWMTKSVSSREAGQRRGRRKENKAVVLCESLRLGPASRDEIVCSFTASHGKGKRAHSEL
jgi:hypothetical protein